MTALQGFGFKDGHGNLHVLYVCAVLCVFREQRSMPWVVLTQMEEAHAELSRVEVAAGLTA